MGRLEKNLPVILTSVATAGVIGTGILSYRAGQKTNKTWKSYVPPILCGAGTIGCLWAAQILNGKQIAALTVSCGYLVANRDALERKIREHYGEDDLQEIKQEVKAELEHSPWGKITIPKGIEETGRGNLLVIEGYSGRIFRSSIVAVNNGIRRFQKRFFDNHGFVSLNDLYECLGIQETHFGHQYGWPCWNDELDESFWTDQGGVNIKCELVNDPIDLNEPVYCIDIYDYPMECWQEM